MRRDQIIRNINRTTDEIEESTQSELNDDGDRASFSTENLIDTAIAQKQYDELSEIEHALGKASQGTFGICEMCGEHIGLERMRVKPQAKYCIFCRETYERNGSAEAHSSSHHFVTK